MNAGTRANAADFNGLFTRLDAIRANHLNKNGQNATANQTFATAFNTNIAAVGARTMSANVQALQNTINTLEQSAWLSGTDFSAKIPIPPVGSLLQAVNFNTYDNTVKEMEGICPNYSQYGQYNQYGAYTDYQYAYGDGWWL